MAQFRDGSGVRHFLRFQHVKSAERARIPDPLVVELFHHTSKLLSTTTRVRYSDFQKHFRAILCGKVEHIVSYKVVDDTWYFNIRLNTRQDLQWRKLDHMPEGLDELSWDVEMKARFDLETRPFPRERIEKTRMNECGMEVLIKFVRCSNKVWLSEQMLVGSLGGNTRPQVLQEILQWRNNGRKRHHG